MLDVGEVGKGAEVLRDGAFGRRHRRESNMMLCDFWWIRKGMEGTVNAKKESNVH